MRGRNLWKLIRIGNPTIFCSAVLILANDAENASMRIPMPKFE